MGRFYVHCWLMVIIVCSFVRQQAISSITEGVSAAAASTEEPMQSNDTESAEAAPAEEGATAMEAQAEVATV